MTIETVRLPIRPRALPEAGAVEVWITDLSSLPIDTGPPASSRREEVMRRRVQQRFLLRLLLGAYLGCPGKDVELARNERGKPALGGRHAGSGLAFNISHSGSWLAVAAACGTQVGIDLEVERRLPRAALLARRFLSRPEADWLAGLDEPFRSRQFLKQWTAREALVKARGMSLAGCLGEIELGWRPPSVRRLPADWYDAAGSGLIALSLPEGLVGHLSTTSRAVQVTVRRLTS